MFTPDEIDPWDADAPVEAPPLTFKFAATGSGTVTPPAAAVPAPVQPDNAAHLTFDQPE